MMHSNRRPNIVNLSTPTQLNQEIPVKIGGEDFRQHPIQCK